MPPTSTRKDYRQYVIKRFYKPRYPIISTTTTEGTKTTMKDSILAPSAQDTDYLKAWVYITELVANGPAIGTVARVTNVDFSGANHTLIVAPAVTATTAIMTGTDYELHYKYHPNYVEDLIEEIMGNLEVSYLIPLTMASGGDMEGTPATDFNASAEPSLLATDTTYVLHGRQSLKVTSLANDDYAYSDTIWLPPSSQVLVSADCYITYADSAKLILYDVGGSAAIETAESDVTGWVHLEFATTTPSTCESVQVRLEGQTAGDIIYWDNVIVLPIYRNLFTPPDEAEYPSDFGKLYYYPKGADIPGSGNDYATKIFEGKPEHFCHYNIERDDTAVVPMRVVLDKTPITHPLWLECDVDFAALTDDTTTSTAPLELVGQLVLGELYDDWADEEEEMGHQEAAGNHRANAMRARAKVAGDFHNFRQFRTVTKGAL